MNVAPSVPRALLLTAGLAVGLGLTLSARQQPFKSGARTVAVYATVTDATGRLVPDLTKDDFEIYDNGKAQTPTSFGVNPEALNLVIMLDTSGSMAAARGVIESASRAANELLTRFSVEDKGLVGSFNDKITFRPAGGFTGSIELLQNSLKQLPVGYPTRLYDALGETIERLETTRGRRAIVVLTDGDDNSSKLNAGEIEKRARIAQVAIYGIGIVTDYMSGQGHIRSSPGRDLKNLCVESGGTMPVLKNSVEWGQAFARIAEELHSQYAIGFSPQAVDRKVHKLDVKLKKPGLTARARKSYVAAPTNR
jgi:Ca-activated chloride channel family protein